MKQIPIIGLIVCLILPVSARQEEGISLPASYTLTYLHMNFLQQLFTPKDKRTLAEIVGPLKPNPDYKGWYESEPVHIPYLHQKLKITFSQGDDSVFMTHAEVVLKRFLQLKDEDHLHDSKMVEQYYQVCVTELGINPLPIKDAKDVWNHVTPTQIFIEKNINGKYYVTLSCKCDWDKTHGLQLVFRDGKKLTRASGHHGQYENWN